MKQRKLLGVSLKTISMEMLIGEISRAIENRQQELFFSFNANSSSYLVADPVYARIMRGAGDLCADGTSIVWAARLLGIPIRERLATTDLIIKLLDYLNTDKQAYRIFFLGGREDTAAKAVSRFKKEYPQANLAGYYSPPFMSLAEMRQGENDHICQIINSKAVDILFVGFGTPKQEKWVMENRDKLKVAVIIPCGGMLGFYGGEYKRAPRFLQQLGVEWFLRLVQEPKRLWKRYLIGNVVFLRLVAQQILRTRIFKKSLDIINNKVV